MTVFLIDYHGTCISTTGKDIWTVCEKVFQICKYRNADALERDQVGQYTAQVLERTKGSFNSPTIENLRHVFEHPADYFIKGAVFPDYATYYERAS